MKNDLQVTIPIVPRGTGRPRACIRGGHASAYKAAADVSHHDAMVAYLMAYQGRPRSTIIGAVSVEIEVYLPRPVKFRKASGLAIPCAKRPDCDNLAKGVLDALMTAGWMRDDGQVWELHVAKYYHEINGIPRYEVTIHEEV